MGRLFSIAFRWRTPPVLLGERTRSAVLQSPAPGVQNPDIATLRASCPNCGGVIDHDAATSGEITCPHCNNRVRLPAGPPPLSAPTQGMPAGKKKSAVWIIVLVIVAVVMGCTFILGLLAAIAVPNFIKAREAAQRSTCVANLRMIHGAKEIWAVENRKDVGDRPSDAELFGPGLQMPKKPVCPAGGAYTVNPVGEAPTCSVPTHSIAQQ